MGIETKGDSCRAAAVNELYLPQIVANRDRTTASGQSRIPAPTLLLRDEPTELGLLCNVSFGSSRVSGIVSSCHRQIVRV